MAIYNRIDDYISYKEVWNGNEFEHLTLASTINTCNSFLKKSKDTQILNKAQELKLKSENALLEKCLNQDILGYYYWKLPINEAMSKFEFYLTYFSLTQVMYLLKDLRIQSIVKRILKNTLESEVGIGLPLHNLESYSEKDVVKPDFGTTASMVYILHYIIENQIGNHQWIDFCKSNFNEYPIGKLDLSLYDLPVISVLSLLANIQNLQL